MMAATPALNITRPRAAARPAHCTWSRDVPNGFERQGRAQHVYRGGAVIVTNPFGPGSWTGEQIKSVSRGWWALLVTGLLSVVAGGIIVLTDWTVADLVVFVGALLVFRGFFTLFGVPVDGSARTWSIVFGLVELGVGIAVWTWPGPTLLVVAAFIGWLLLFRGVMTIAGSLSSRGVIPYWGLVLAFGILETVVSFYLLARPGLTLVSAVLAIGLLSMFYGVAQIVLAFEVRRLPASAEDVARDLNDATASRTLDSARR
jgi:uncharacterized membrane protein HdeD (DUF308 family)